MSELGDHNTEHSPRLQMAGDLDDVQDYADEQGWSDGLPIIPPTEERVQRVLGDFDGDQTIGAIPPGYGDATLEVLAANAVMAGCRPAYFPIVVAAMQAMLEPQFNLNGIQSTTHPVAPLVVVHGPIAQKVGMNSGSGVLGPGSRPNATIGRAVRLILMNVGGARPGQEDRATQGAPAKFTYCMAENVADGPWPELHTTRGFEPAASAVSVIGCESPHNVQDHESNSGQRFLDIVADSMRGLGHNSWYLSQGNDFVIVLGPEHAQMLQRDGWARQDVQRYLYHRSARPASELRHGGLWEQREWPVWMNSLAEGNGSVPVVRSRDEILILVAGGPGKHSAIMPGFGATHAVTRRLFESMPHK